MHAIPTALCEQLDEFVAIRRDIHAHPELGLKEFRTSALVADRLRTWGYTVTTGLAQTGLVAQLRRGSGSKRLGLRAIDRGQRPRGPRAKAQAKRGQNRPVGYIWAIVIAKARTIGTKGRHIRLRHWRGQGPGPNSQPYAGQALPVKFCAGVLFAGWRHVGMAYYPMGRYLPTLQDAPQ